MNDNIDFDFVGTPRDYSEQLYRFYIEVPDIDGKVAALLRVFLGVAHEEHMVKRTHGFELDLPMQRAPELVRELSQLNHAIYQIVRGPKVDRPYR